MLADVAVPWPGAPSPERKLRRLTGRFLVTSSSNPNAEDDEIRVFCQLAEERDGDLRQVLRDIECSVDSGAA